MLRKVGSWVGTAQLIRSGAAQRRHRTVLEASTAQAGGLQAALEHPAERACKRATRLVASKARRTQVGSWPGCRAPHSVVLRPKVNQHGRADGSRAVAGAFLLCQVGANVTR